MNEEIKAFERIKNHINNNEVDYKDVELVDRKLKALGILIVNGVNINVLLHCKDYKEYKEKTKDGLTEEEYNELLKTINVAEKM